MKKRTLQRMLCLGIAGVMLGTWLTGCERKETQESPGTTAEEIQKEPIQQDDWEDKTEQLQEQQQAPVVILSDLEADITWWTYPIFVQAEGAKPGDYERELVEAFRRYYPNIHVEVEVLDYETGPGKVQAAIAEGKAPDLLLDGPGRIQSYAKAGVLADMESLFTEECKTDLVSENLLSACQYGDLYGMYPHSMVNYVMAFNKEMLETTGAIDLLNREGERGWTTETFMQVLEKLNHSGFKAGSLFCSGVAGDYATRAFLTNLYDVPLMAEDLGSYAFTGSDAVKTLTDVKNWVDQSWMLNGSGETGAQSVEAFVNGETSYTLLWSLPHAIRYREKLEEQGIRIVEMSYPSVDGVPALEYILNGFCVFRQEHAEEEKAAMYLIDYICNGEQAAEYVTRTGAMPVRSSLGDVYQGNEDALFYEAVTPFSGMYYQKVPGFESMRVYWYQMISEVLNGEYDAVGALEGFIEYANETLQTQGE